MADEYFDACVWWTPNQIRDSLFLRTDLTTEFIQATRTRAINEQARRKQAAGFVECPFCKGFHGQLGNIDSLCEQCEANTAPFRYDSKRLLAGA